MTFTEETITPKLAEEYLKHNTGNYRGISKSKVHSLAREMASGNWQYNGETICFDEDGKLLDGQHRLSAIVESGTTVNAVVCRGVNRNVYIYDAGRARSLDNYSAASGLKDARDAANHTAAGLFLNNLERADLPRGMVISHIKDHEETWVKTIQIIRHGNRNNCSRKGPTALAVYCLLRCGFSESELRDFFYVVNTGFPIEGRECSPAIVLRNYLVTGAYRQKYSDYTKRNQMLYSVTCSAFFDFNLGIARKKAYTYSSGNMMYLTKARKADGLI